MWYAVEDGNSGVIRCSVVTSARLERHDHLDGDVTFTSMVASDLKVERIYAP